MFGKFRALFSVPELTPKPAAADTLVPGPTAAPALQVKDEDKPSRKKDEEKENLKPAGNEGQPPPPPLPLVYNRYADDTLREVVKRLKERTDMYKEKVIDPYATSPEISPAVTNPYRSDY
ncbi:hypothetical protein DPEC_G00074720 [Dallia pectoralis]|uniref:Uncharacterized protein n=1 Tax=Dallia pectoralis TaxID=75939 RepID=A0ACC2H4E1_DALPE|nr:hypothetical protein DPEC_G00074720 [Dallia pectoralis]